MRPFFRLVFVNRQLPSPCVTISLGRELSNVASRFGIRWRNTQVVEAITSNWPQLLRHLHKSKLSKSIPVGVRGPGRAVAPRHTFDSLLELRAEIRSTSHFLLRADVSNFYDSVYTHTIPWAIHTREWAKKPTNRYDMNALGNILDKRAQRGQSDQTIGIPVGPDSSFVMAEVSIAAGFEPV